MCGLRQEAQTLHACGPTLSEAGALGVSLCTDPRYLWALCLYMSLAVNCNSVLVGFTVTLGTCRTAQH